MAAPTFSRWSEQSRELDVLLECDAPAREARLRELRAHDADLAGRLAALLARDGSLDRDGFLDGTAVPRETMATLAGMTVGAYTLVRLVGEGGMGTVWLATRSDGRFEGTAAVKLLNLALLGEGGLARFRREGRILGRLAHPNIARLLDAGVSAVGQPYLILEYVEGDSIDRHCDTQRLDTRARIELFLGVLEAVSHAHHNLVLHRDLKPSNILVARDGAIKLLDFGIAKLLNDEDGGGAATEVTRVGGRAYTPDYATPEQVLGTDVTTATDVYALGVLLYVLLCGQHPTNGGDSPVERLRAIVERDPLRMSPVALRAPPDVAACRAATPRELARRLQGDLDTIVARALRKAPAERYATVDALADDLRRHLRQEPVQVRPATFGYRASRFVRRNGTAVALAALAFLALVGGLAGTLSQAHRATRQADLAREARERADREAAAASDQRDFALRQLSRAEAINDLNNFLLADAAPSGKPLDVGELLARAEGILDHAPGPADANRVAMLVELGGQYKFLDRDDKARELLARAYSASRALDDPSARASAACNYAYAIAAAGEHDRAEALRDALKELPEAPQYTLDRLKCYYRGSAIAHVRGNGKLAIERAEAQQRLLAQLRFPSPAWQLQVLTDLGESYRVGDRLDDAIATFERAAGELSALARADTATATTVYNNWALALYQAGRTLEAEARFRRAVANSSGTARPEVSPMLLVNLARTLDRLDHVAEAHELATRAYQAAHAAGDASLLPQAALVRSSTRGGSGTWRARASCSTRPRGA